MRGIDRRPCSDFMDMLRRLISCRIIIIIIIIDIAYLSVRLSVRYVPVLDENGLTYCHFHHTVAQSFWFYHHQTSSRNSDGVKPGHP